MLREIIEFDVVIVGGGPAGLAAACRLGQLSEQTGTALDVCVVEKGSEIGAHILSGAVMELRALEELFSDWRALGAPVSIVVNEDALLWLRNARSCRTVPRWLVPSSLHNEGHFIIRLGELCQWLARQAESLGCSVLTGVAATELLLGEGGEVQGVATGALGIDRSGHPKPGSEPGYELRAKYVVFAEGCRGNLARQLDERFGLSSASDPQHYGIGLKEVWEVPSQQHTRGRVEHTLGWPLGLGVDGGGFVYHGVDNQIALGLVVSLAYRNPHLDPFEEFQRWKQHPRIRQTLEGGRRIAYGARAVNKGGLQSLPRLVFPGGLLVGCGAGFLNPAKIKGTHTALKTGMLGAEAVFRALGSGATGGRGLESYEDALRDSWVLAELAATRNFAPAVARFGAVAGGALAFVEQNLLRRSLPMTLRNRHRDRDCTLPASRAARIDYPRPDGVISFDKLSSVHLANIRHEEDQPVHLVLADADLPLAKNLPEFDEPAQRYCPAAVYEIVRDGGAEPRFQINAANCIHCKTCDIKDPADNIRWLPPEGGSGPNYVRM
jgi:electron-transferring-flavoprotein dehydrogenase